MDGSSGVAASAGPPSATARIGYQVAYCVLGAAIGAVIWYGLAVPQHLINVIFSAFIGVGAGLGAGRVSGEPRSARGVVLAVGVTMLVLIVAQAIITREYLTWATDHLGGTPSDPSWDGAVGAVRLAFDRAAGRKGWSPNARYFWWLVSLVLAGCMAWFTARPATGRAAVNR